MLPSPQRVWNAISRRIRHARVLAQACRTTRQVLDSKPGGTVLVLCYGNIYRSPFVERKVAAALDPGRWEVRSAGFHPRTGRECAPDYIKLASEYGVDLSDHRSKCVSKEDILESDVVVIMDRRNWDQLNELAPEASSKVVWIGCALRDGQPEVQDPYARSEHEVRQIVERLNSVTESLARMFSSG